MRLTKEMKKVVSMFLATALVVASANFTDAKTVSAQDETAGSQAASAPAITATGSAANGAADSAENCRTYPVGVRFRPDRKTPLSVQCAANCLLYLRTRFSLG